MTREQQLYFELGKKWSNENGDIFRYAISLLAEEPSMPVQDIVRNMTKKIASDSTKRSLQASGGGFVMNSALSGRFGDQPMVNR